MTPGAPTVGAVLLGKYRIERMLGEGGMGVVAMAHHLQLDEPVAIKFLLSELLGKQEIVQRFLREAQAAVKLKSEHVARVIDVGTLENGSPYMVMEYLDGGDLGAMIKHYGAFAPSIAVDLIVQACDALAEAHALGIVHRDIKPSNLFITRRRDGSPLLKVLDFGISKAPVTLDAGLTRTQSVMGTPAYMSPEQMRSTKSVDARADIWSIGVVLYEALGGRRPFEGEAYSELCIRVAMDPPAPLLVPLPHGLDAVIAGCLEKDPAHRFQSIAELTLALAPYASDPAQAAVIAERCARTQGRVPGPRAATPPPVRTLLTPTPASVTGAAGQVPTTIQHPPRKRAPLILALGAFFVIGGAIAAFLATRSPSGAPTPAAAVPPDARSEAVADTTPVDAGVAAQVVTPDAGVAVVALPPDAGPEVATVKPVEPDKKRPKKKKKKRGSGDGEVDLFGSRE